MDNLYKKNLIKILKADNSLFKGLNKELKNNEVFIEDLIKNKVNIFPFIKNKNKLFFLSLENNMDENYKFLSNDLKEDSEILDKLLSVKIGNKNWFINATQKLKENKELILRVVEQNGWSIQYISKNLKKDIEIANKAIEKDARAFQYLDESLRNNKELAIKTVKKNPHMLSDCSKSLKNDKEVVWEAVNNNEYAFNNASKEILKTYKHDPQFFLKLVGIELNNKKINEKIKEKVNLKDINKQIKI